MPAPLTEPASASIRPSTRKPALRQQLFWLTLGTLLPVITFAVVGAVLLAQHERSIFERGARDRTLAVQTAVEAELKSTTTSLEVLAASRYLETDDLRAFQDEAERAKATQPDWLSLNLASVSGQQVISVLRPFGSELPPIQEQRSFQQVLQTGQPSVGDIVIGALTRQPDFAVRVPVMRAGKVRYVLSAVVKPESIFRLWQAQQLPASWIGVVVDRNKRFVARTIDNSERLGQVASRDLQTALDASPQGWLQGRTLDGTRVYTAHHISSSNGWSVALGVPANVVEASAWKATLFVLIGTLAAVLVAFGLAHWLSRRIVEPITALASSANAMARGEATSFPPKVEVKEFAELGTALVDAGAAVQARVELQRQLEAVTSNATVALFMLDAHQVCTFMNPAAESMTGYTFAEVRGRPLHDIVHRREGEDALHSLAECSLGLALITNEARQGHEVYVHRNGHFFDVAYATSPLRAAGKPVGAIVEARDITVENSLEAERGALLLREQQARTEAEASNAAKDEFLAMLGHELRNPLAAISNASHLLDQPGSEHAERAKGVIKRQAGHLARLVDDLLDAGRVASGKIVLAQGPVNMAEVVHRTLATLGASARTYRHSVTVDLDQLWVLGDETRLEQIVTNLLTNALRYTPAGGRVDITLKADASDVLLTVADNGIGIPSEMLARVFDLFVQGDRGLEREHGGLGIGLTLVKRLTELHGGFVSVASEGVDRGSLFRIRLPRIVAPAQAIAPSISESDAPISCRILIIEDNADARAMLRAILELAGHSVTESDDGPGGLSTALTSRPEAVVIDVGLPGLSGYEVARRIRATLNGEAVKLIALTGYGQKRDREQALAAGFDLHLVKPVDAQELLNAVVAAPRR